MDENQFFAGLQGEAQQNTDLVSGAEHFVRLKKQVGLQRETDEGLELEKSAGELTEMFGNEEGTPKDERSDVVARLKARYKEKCANSIAQRFSEMDPIMKGLILGGSAVGGVGTYLASKPRPELGGKSKAEDELEAQVATQQGRPEDGLLRKMRNRHTEFEHGYAKAFRYHPGKAALIGAATGGVGGYGLGRLAGAISKMRGGAA